MAGIAELKKLSVEEIADLIKQSTNYRTILRLFDINVKNKPAKDYLMAIARDNNISTSHFKMGIPAELIYSLEDMSSAVEKSICWSDVIRFMGRKVRGNNISTFKRLVKHYNLDISHFSYKEAISRSSKIKTKTSECSFIVDSKSSRASIKQYILKNNILPYICDHCGLTDTWNNKLIVLQLEHKNGVSNDDRLENLCFLCPNCHSQTPTFGRKKRIKT